MSTHREKSTINMAATGGVHYINIRLHSQELTNWFWNVICNYIVTIFSQYKTINITENFELEEYKVAIASFNNSLKNKDL